MTPCGGLRPNNRRSPLFFLWATLLIVLSLAPAVRAQQTGAELPPLELRIATTELHKALAGPQEEAFVQILTQVTLLRDPQVDSVAVYDITVDYDPRRYSNPRVGTYPLNFADQFILWGKRISLYTRRMGWLSGRFYLRDISNGHVAWIRTVDARHLYAPEKVPSNSKRWLRFVYATPPYIDLSTMSQWLRLMRDEDREMVELRLRAEAEARANSLTKDLE